MKKNYSKKCEKGRNSEMGSRKKNKKSIRIYDSEEDETNKKLSLKNDKQDSEDNLDGYDFVEDESEEEDIPITVIDDKAMEVIELSNKKKKIILDSLNKNQEIVLNKRECDERKTIHSNTKKSKRSEKGRIGDNVDNTKVLKNRKTNKCRNGSEDLSISDSDSDSNSHYDARYDSDSDMSLPRRTGIESEDTDNSRNPRYDSDSDMSLPRRTGVESEDTYSSRSESITGSEKSNERRKRTTRKVRSNRERDSSTSSKNTLVSDSSDMNFIYYADETNKDILEGVNKTIYRDAQGNVISREEWIKEQKERMQNRNKRKKEVTKPKELEWASGLVQKKMQENIIKENERILQNRNIVNYDFDPYYDNILKNRRREEDPMNIYLKKEEEKNEKNRKKETNEKPTCRFQTPYNRFNITAGYRWDGVVRGNGYEQKWYQALRMKQQQAKTSYMNSSYGI